LTTSNPSLKRVARRPRWRAAGAWPLGFVRQSALNAATPAILIPFDGRWLNELISMWRASFEAGVGIVDPHPLEEQFHYFSTSVIPHYEVRLALLAVELVGFVAASADTVAQLYVRVGFQRRGIGTQLLAWAKEQANGTLCLYTFARNLGARAFYERNGFVAIAHGFEPMWQLEDIKYEWLRREHAA
jgi:GNAT superfamily N-acetyltransferase